MVLLPGPYRAPPNPPPLCLCLYWLGGVLLIPCPPKTHPTLMSMSVLVESGVCYQTPRMHPRLRRGPCSSRESQITLRVLTQMSSVRSPATNSRSSRHDFYCDRNTTARQIRIEEKALSINSFIVQWKERYLIPSFIVVSITMPLVDVH